MSVNSGLPVAPRKVRSDKGGRHKVNGEYTGVKPPRGKKQAGQRADGLPKNPQMVRKGGREYGYTKYGKQLSAGWIVDKGAPAPKAPEDRYPVSHPLWAGFVQWVETGSIVRRDLLKSHPEAKSGGDWEQMWLIFLAGASC